MRKQLKELVSSGDTDFIEVVKHSFWAFIVLGLATGAQFLFDLLLARSFNADGVGIFYLCFSVVMMLSLFARLGTDRALIKFIPPFIDKKDTPSARGAILSAIRIVRLNSVAIAILLFIFSPLISKEIFNDPSLAPYLRIFSLAIPPFSLRMMYSGVLKSFKKTRQALFAERLSTYGLGLLALITAGFTYGFNGMVIGFVASCFLGWFITIAFVKKQINLSGNTIKFSKSSMLLTSLPLLFVAFATQMIGQVSVLMLGIFSTNTEVGIFNVALKVSYLMTIVLTAVNVITSTNISKLYAKKEYKKLELLLSKTSAFGFMLAIPLFIVMVAFPSQILSLFGSEFSTGSNTLIVMAVGQLINVAVGATLFTLSLTGKEKILALTVGGSLLLNIILGLIFIPTFGVLGAGIATGISVATSNIIMLIHVKRHLGIWTLPFKSMSIWFSKIFSMLKS